MTSVFHEQNHRILWTLLPPPQGDMGAIRRYLNLAESLVIILDMALSDALVASAGQGAATMLYASGAIYDPGTAARSEIRSPRGYRNYLQAARHATWLALETYEPSEIPHVVRASHSGTTAAESAAKRAITIDPHFIGRTNPEWQRRHAKEVARRFSRPRAKPIKLADSPQDSTAAYAIAERVFEVFGL